MGSWGCQVLSSGVVGVSGLLGGVVPGLRLGHMQHTLTLSLGQEPFLLALRCTNGRIVVGQTGVFVIMQRLRLLV